MSKVYVGDYVYHENHRQNGTVISDRGGHVGRYLLLLDNGERCHASSRDLTVIKTSRAYPSSRASIKQKLDLLLDYLGLEIEDTIRVVEKQSDEKESD